MSLAVNAGVWADEPEPHPPVLKWKDAEGESYYRVSGTITYESGCRYRPIRTEKVEFSQVLPADTTAYRPPLPKNNELPWVKQYYYEVEAFDSKGNMILRQGSGLIGDAFCREPASRTWSLGLGIGIMLFIALTMWRAVGRAKP